MGQNFSSEPVVEKDTERDQNENFNVAVSSCQGWRTSQEDNHSMILNLPGSHKASLFAVYDGHGSARVSKHASESLWKHLTENEAYKKGDFKQALESAFLTFDREVNESYNAQLAGTTAVCILIVDNIVYCANIGDSRSVASINCECVPLSHDHKPENPAELKRILAAGGYVLGNRVNGNLALSRAFGDFHYKGNDQLPPDQQIVSPCPDIQCIELNDDVDFIVLACDGIWDVLSSEEVVKFVINRLERNIEPATICEQLTTRCLATDYELVIGCDNMTVLLVCYTRGRSWEEYCTDIFNKNTKKLGIPRTRTFGTEDLDQLDHQGHFQAQQSTRNVSQEEQQISSNSLSYEQSSEDSTNSGRTGGDAAKNMSTLLNMFESLGFGRFELSSQNMDGTCTNLDYDEEEEEEDRCKIEEVEDDNDNNQKSDYSSNVKAFDNDTKKNSDEPQSCGQLSSSSTETTLADQSSVLTKPTSDDMCRIEEVEGLNRSDIAKQNCCQDQQIDESNICEVKEQQSVEGAQRDECQTMEAKDCDESSPNLIQENDGEETCLLKDDGKNEELSADAGKPDCCRDQGDSDDTQAKKEDEMSSKGSDKEEDAGNNQNDIIQESNESESTKDDTADQKQINSEPDNDNNDETES